jgi:Flp pilus assembly protein TadG
MSKAISDRTLAHLGLRNFIGSGSGFFFRPRTLQKRQTGRNAGSAAVEFAVTAPMLVALVIGAADYAFMAYSQEAIEGATRAGAEYARATPGDGPSWTNTKTYVTGYTTFSPALNSFACTSGTSCVTTVYTCVDGTNAGSTLAAATTFCNSHQPTDPRVLQYVSVTATQTFTPLLSWSAFGFPSQLSAVTVARIQ